VTKLPITVSSLSREEKAFLGVIGVCVDIISPGSLLARDGLSEDPLESPDEGSKLTRIVGKTSCSVVFLEVGLKDNRPTVFIAGNTRLKCTSVHVKPRMSTLGYPRYRNYPWIIRYG